VEETACRGLVGRTGETGLTLAVAAIPPQWVAKP